MLRLLIEVRVQDSEITAVGGLRPQSCDMLEVFLRVDQADVLVCYYSVDGADVFDLGVAEVEFLLEEFHDDFYTLGFLGVGSFALVFGHAGVVD